MRNAPPIPTKLARFCRPRHTPLVRFDFSRQRLMWRAALAKTPYHPISQCWEAPNRRRPRLRKRVCQARRLASAWQYRRAKFALRCQIPPTQARLWWRARLRFESLPKPPPPLPALCLCCLWKSAANPPLLGGCPCLLAPNTPPKCQSCTKAWCRN